MTTHATTRKRSAPAALVARVARTTGLTQNQVRAVCEEIITHLEHDLRGEARSANLLGLLKIRVTHRPARPERRGISPFTGKEVLFQAKPVRKGVKVLALKALRDLVS